MKILTTEFYWSILVTLFLSNHVSPQITSKSAIKVEGYSLPLLPSVEKLTVMNNYHHLYNLTNHVSRDKIIPRNAWIAVRGDQEVPGNVKDMINENPTWIFHICDNTCKDQFMSLVFNGTSVGWAYDMLNPEIGVAKAELWRLCILYMFGGMFLDDDSYVAHHLDTIVRADDKFIISPELNGIWKDNCYTDEFELSNRSFNDRYGLEANSQVFFNNHYFLNWLMFAAPQHPVIVRSLQHAVNLIKGEYLCHSYIKVFKHEHRGKLLMCATTFPIMLATRELLLETVINITASSQHKHIVNVTQLHQLAYSIVGVRVVSSGFAEYGGKMKAWYSDYRPDHWLKVMSKKSSYLRAYKSEVVNDIIHHGKEGMLLSSPGTGKRVFIIRNGTRKYIPDADTFYTMKLDFGDVNHITNEEMEKIPFGGNVLRDHS